MKKLFIGLLIVVAGTGVFYFSKPGTCNKPAQYTDYKELIIGKWKSITTDTDFNKYTTFYQFTYNNNIQKSLTDSLYTDTAFYQWQNENKLVWRRSESDSIGIYYLVTLLNTDSLQLEAADSSKIQFKRVK